MMFYSGLNISFVFLQSDPFSFRTLLFVLFYLSSLSSGPTPFIFLFSEFLFHSTVYVFTQYFANVSRPNIDRNLMLSFVDLFATPMFSGSSTTRSFPWRISWCRLRQPLSLLRRILCAIWKRWCLGRSLTWKISVSDSDYVTLCKVGTEQIGKVIRVSSTTHT